MPITWNQINPSAPGSPLAGRHDTPAESPADAAAAVVQQFFSSASTYAVENRIATELENLAHQAERMLPAGTTDGVVAQICLDTISEVFTGTTATSVRAAILVGPPYHFTSPTLGVRQAQRTGGVWEARGSMTFRYYWGVRS